MPHCLAASIRGDVVFEGERTQGFLRFPRSEVEQVAACSGRHLITEVIEKWYMGARPFAFSSRATPTVYPA